MDRALLNTLGYCLIVALVVFIASGFLHLLQGERCHCNPPAVKTAPKVQT